eukprot:GEMP01039188.1.p1 GENE.GEMP01039188.1~~GEMP01039188.1.p1  ORF type:complete len:329 (+),score=43.37 GEMP01039188.1:82-1068(+)
MAVHHSALPRTYIEGSAGTSTYKEDCDGLSSSDELMKALFSSPEFALQCDLPVSSRTTHCGTSYDGGIHSPRLSLSLRHDESPPSQASSRTLCPTESFSPADNATQPAGERTMPRGHVQSALRGGVQFWDRRPAERDEACHDYEKYVQRIDLLEKQLRQRTETARDFAETIDHLMMKHQLMENQIATVVASQGEFLQDFSLFLVARDILSKATSLEMFKEQIATRLEARVSFGNMSPWVCSIRRSAKAGKGHHLESHDTTGACDVFVISGREVRRELRYSSELMSIGADYGAVSLCPLPSHRHETIHILPLPFTLWSSQSFALDIIQE